MDGKNDIATSDSKFDFCLDAINQITKLQNVKFDDTVIPMGSFSKFIQVDLVNKSIPEKLTSIDLETTWDCLTNIFKLFTDSQPSKFHQINNQLYDFCIIILNSPLKNFRCSLEGFSNCILYVITNQYLVQIMSIYQI